MDQRPICVICHKNVCKRKKQGAGSLWRGFARFCSTCYDKRHRDPEIAAAFVRTRRTPPRKITDEEIATRLTLLGPIQRPACSTCHVRLALYKGTYKNKTKHHYGKECYACLRKRKLAGNVKPRLSHEERALRKKLGLSLHLHRRRYRLHLKDRCERCGFVPEAYCQLTVHHLDKNHKNNDPLNLKTLCHNCHNLIHHLDRVSTKTATS